MMAKLMRLLRSRRKIKVGSIVRAKAEVVYPLSDFPLGKGTFERFPAGSTTKVLKLGTKIGGGRQLVVDWFGNDEHRHIINSTEVELVR
jgi:hypothetical protein